MPELTLTGWKHKIRAYCDTNGIVKSDSQVSRMALKVSKRMASLNTVEDWERALRILGISADPTAVQALIPRKTPTRHMNDRLPGEPLMHEAVA